MVTVWHRSTERRSTPNGKENFGRIGRCRHPNETQRKLHSTPSKAGRCNLRLAFCGQMPPLLVDLPAFAGRYSRRRAKSFIIALTVLVGFVSSSAALGQTTASVPSNEDCQTCHSEGSTASAVFAQSTHASLACVDCHTDLATTTEFPHPEKLSLLPVSRVTKKRWRSFRTAFTRRGGGGSACQWRQRVRAAMERMTSWRRPTLPAACTPCESPGPAAGVTSGS